MDPTFMTFNSGPMWLLTLVILWRLLAWYRGWNDEEEEDDGLVEGLSDYYDALKESDKQALIGQEEYFKKYKLKTFSDEQFAQLKQSETADLEKIIMGVATYRILDNLQYQQDLQYEPNRKKADGSCERDGVVLISTDENPPTGEGERPVNDVSQMDATYLAVNLAFLSERQQQSFNMDTTEGKSLF
mmetsp:Transcript_27157/g.33767  ORF Transcript_27157/g.33767 Transcript_27157/m.33767 type:complete len:187 (-) Transcript_27157:330-890(-)